MTFRMAEDTEKGLFLLFFPFEPEEGGFITAREVGSVLELLFDIVHLLG